jgi:hypothetical protein
MHPGPAWKAIAFARRGGLKVAHGKTAVVADPEGADATMKIGIAWVLRNIFASLRTLRLCVSALNSALPEWWSRLAFHELALPRKSWMLNY